MYRLNPNKQYDTWSSFNSSAIKLMMAKYRRGLMS